MIILAKTSVKFDDRFFDRVLQSEAVKALTKRAADKALAYARAHAPVDSGAYRDGLEVQAVKHAHRTTYQVVGTDSKTLLVESETGNLRKALKAGKS